MKKIILLLSLVLFSLLAEANPLFFLGSTVIIIKGNYEYFYTEDGDLLGREDIGSSGMVYSYEGGEWEEIGYFFEENGWCLYYCLENEYVGNEYMGKVKSSTEYYRESPYSETIYSRSSRFYVDEKNRPIATYNERLSGRVGDDFKDVFGVMDMMINPLGALLNGGKPEKLKIFVIKGERRYYGPRF